MNVTVSVMRPQPLFLLTTSTRCLGSKCWTASRSQNCHVFIRAAFWMPMRTARPGPARR